MVRALGIDLGSRRIGVAVSDRSGTIASPFTVLQRGRTHRDDHEAIARLVAEEEAEVVVVGLPLSMSGEVGRAAEAAIDEARELAGVLDVPVETFDERLTTVSAERSMREMSMRAEARRRLVDKVAAAVMLQGWLDAKREADARA